MLPDRHGHEFQEHAGLRECHLCGAVAGTPDAERTCQGSAAEPANIDDWEGSAC